MRVLSKRAVIVLTCICLFKFAYDLPPPAVDGDPAQPWQFGLRYLLQHAVASISPDLAGWVPIAILFLFTTPVWLFVGYKLLERRHLLDHTARRTLFERIRDEPGIHFTGLHRATGINTGTLHYHLAVLEREGKIISHTTGGCTRYFDNHGIIGEHERNVLAYLRNRTDREKRSQRRSASPVRRSPGTCGASLQTESFESTETAGARPMRSTATRQRRFEGTSRCNVTGRIICFRQILPVRKTVGTEMLYCRKQNGLL